jgi:lipopolysaccharide transport system permease protein
MNPTVVEADKPQRGYWLELWRFRELFFFFSWRDLLVRYKQTVIGVLWALIKPFLSMLIFTVVFSKVAKVPSDGLPFPVMVLAGMLPWTLFSTSLTEASNSLILNANMLGKIYFPRLVLPASSVMVTFIDFFISFLMMVVIMAFYIVIPSWQVLLLPAFTLLGLCASFGAGMWLAALNVKFRDFRYIIPFIGQLGIYITPVGYPVGAVRRSLGGLPHPFNHLVYDLYCLNPMVGVINGFRWSIGGGHVPLDWLSVGIALTVTAFLFLTGLRYFRSTEDNFADII